MGLNLQKLQQQKITKKKQNKTTKQTTNKQTKKQTKNLETAFLIFNFFFLKTILR